MQFLYSREFEKRFKKLPQKLQQRTKERLQLFVENEFHPLLDNHPLQGKYKNHRSINITGDWRLVFKKIADDLVRVDLIGTHSELYG